MKVLFFGGTGLISTACAELAVESGIELTVVTRGTRPTPTGATSVVADIHDTDALAEVLATHPADVVVNWVAFTPEDVARDLALLSDRVGQYVFISSASAYEKPPTRYLITEETALSNPYWDYSRNKIACERRLLDAFESDGFPATIVRPSLTYGDTQIPLVTNSWEYPYTIVARMRAGKSIVVPGDGTSLWTFTHNTDFAKGLIRLLGNDQAIGEAIHITSDEVLSWNQAYETVAASAGVEPRPVHVASDFIAACIPEMVGTLHGDKSHSVVFDNTKIKRLLPGYQATTSFAEGVSQAVAWFDADPARRQVDSDADRRWDRLLALYREGQERARARMAAPALLSDLASAES